MEENTPLPQVFVSPDVPSIPVEEKKHPSFVLVYLFVIFVILLFMLFWYLYTHPRGGTVHESTVSYVRDIHSGQTLMTAPEPNYDFSHVLGRERLPFIAPPALGDVINDGEKGYRFRLDSDWEFVPSGSVTVPRLYSDERFTLKRNDYNCYVSFASIVLEDLSEYEKSAQGYHFKSVAGDVGVNRRVDLSRLPEKYDAASRLSASYTTWVPYLPYENASIYFFPTTPAQIEDQALILFASEGGVIPKICDEEFVGMLRTIESV